MLPVVGSEICTLRGPFPRGAVHQRAEHGKSLLAPRAPVTVAADLRLVLADDAIAVEELLDDVGNGFRGIRCIRHGLGIERDRVRHELDVHRRGVGDRIGPAPARARCNALARSINTRMEYRRIIETSRDRQIRSSRHEWRAPFRLHPIARRLQQARSDVRAAIEGHPATRAASARARAGMDPTAPARSSASTERTHRAIG